MNTPGDLDANVTVLDSIQGFGDASKHVVNVDGEFAAGRTFSVGGTVLAGTNSSLGGMAFGASGLKGQVLINANPSLSGQWLAPIAVGSTTLAPTPGYDELPASLGSGAVGVIPFELHDEGSSPANPPIGVPPTPINMGSGSVVLEFYGPIRAETTNDPIEIVFVSTTWPVAVDATAWFNWSISGRTLTVVRDPAQCLPPGSYTITPKRTGSDRLLCNVAGLTGGASVPVADFDYLFEVNGSGSGCSCYTIYECAPCAADFDNNGGVDGGDLAAFFLNYEQGCPCADVDGNGGVDGGDLAYFFTVYEAGGC